MKKRTHQGGGKVGSIRIIAGQWRGSRLPVADLPGLRPSGDRGRETLFNWLQSHIRGAHCVDLFAGSGALGMEAASRGAEHVVLVEKAAQAVTVLKQNAERLGAGQVEVVSGDAFNWLQEQHPLSIDIAFVDPPFALELTARVLETIDTLDVMKPGGLIYVETARSDGLHVPGAGWEVIRDKVIGEVRMVLLKKAESFESN